MSPISLTATIETWPLREAFVIARGAKTEARVVVATVSDGHRQGRGECVPYPRYGETVWLRGRTHAYPFGLMWNPSFLFSALAARAVAPLRAKPTTAAEWYRAQYGRRLADDVAIPITEAWSGARAEELDASVGDKFATSLPRTILLKLAGRVSKRTVAVGYSSTFRESPHVWHVYPEGGIGAVCERLADEVRDAIHIESPVEAILVEGDRAVGVRVKGEVVPATAVISTAPVHVLAKLVQGTDRLAHLSRFTYRPMVFVNVKLDGPSGLPDVVTWTPGPETPFFRLSDIGAGLPWLVPAGRSLVTCDIGCQVGDDVWSRPDEELGQLCVAGLERLVPGIAARYLGCRVMRTPLAYPVHRRAHEADRERFEQGTGVEGLISIGRNGEFAHILMEDVYWRTRRKLMALIDAAATPPVR